MTDRSSTGLDPNLAGLLCYLLTIVSGLVFLIVEKEDRYVRFHAYQSVATFGALLILSIAVRLVPLVGGIVSALVGPVAVILWVILMVKAYQGERFKLPAVGDWAEQQAAAVGPGA